MVGASTSIAPAILSGLRNAGIDILATERGRPVHLGHVPDLAFAELDLSRRSSFDAFAQHNVAEFGKLDIVLFLAGILPGKSLADYTDTKMDEVMEVNFTAQAALLQRLLPHLNPGAHVLMMASISGERGSFDPIYAASKAAQIAFVKSLATWLAPNVRVNALAPAVIEGSSMYLAMSPERRAYHLAQSPTRRLTTMDELSGIIVDLCSPAWGNVNGQVIRVNGGVHV